MTISELITGIGVLLGQLPLSACPAVACDPTRGATIACVIRGVGAALAGCQPETPAPATPTPTPATATPVPCVSERAVQGTVAIGGTLVLPLVPEGLPPDATIASFPCVPAHCAPGERPQYAVPCGVVHNCPLATATLVSICTDTMLCPSMSQDGTFVWGAVGVSRCPRSGSTTIVSTAEIRCADGAVVDREVDVAITIPGDCNHDGIVTADEAAQVAHANATGGDACGADLDLDGFVSPTELDAVNTYAANSARSGSACP